MTEIRDYTYTSALAPYIEGFISEKRALGFIYNNEAYELFRFDRYWKEQGFPDHDISRDRLDDWLIAGPGEGKAGHDIRVDTVRHLSEYMLGLGVPVYVPLLKIKREQNRGHIFTGEEIREFFSVVDHYKPGSINPSDYRMAREYPLIFRLYYCCGMRNNEVCSLETDDIDLESGIITVRDGKNQKDRLVYLPEDLRKMALSYYRYLIKELGFSTKWFFPGRFPDKHVGKTQIDKRFRLFWAETKASETCDKRPTPHCLRHTFVVDRINRWIEDGLELDVMLSYLSKYLGHADPDETFYYYHMVSDAFRIIRAKDRTAGNVIPEVRRR